MRTFVCAASAATVVVLVAAATTSTAAAATPTGSVLGPGRGLTAGHVLRSGDGRSVLSITGQGRAELTRNGRLIWATRTAGAGAALRVAASGNVALARSGRTVWQTNTRGAGRTRLVVGKSGLTLTSGAGTIWSTRLGNSCRHARQRHKVVVDLSRQRAWLCAKGQQVLTTSVTTGATRHGDGTPTGTWKVYAKVRNTTLRPAGGGAYHVHYWMPYHGAYGMHDSPWQHFAYGSRLYRTRGSHGCVHFPAAAMRRLFHWAPRGTTVSIHR
jgi:L,D-transpeptidase-like protein